MSKAAKTILILVIIAALVVIVVLATGNGEDTPNVISEEEVVEMDETEDENELEEEFEDEADMANVSISYTDSGFTPANVTVQQGESVTWINESSGNMWVASDVHPTHELLSEFDQLGTGDVYSFTFEDTGEWTYHNHVNAGHTGTITVE